MIKSLIIIATFIFSFNFNNNRYFNYKIKSLKTGFQNGTIILENNQKIGRIISVNFNEKEFEINGKLSIYSNKNIYSNYKFILCKDNLGQTNLKIEIDKSIDKINKLNKFDTILILEN